MLDGGGCGSDCLVSASIADLVVCGRLAPESFIETKPDEEYEDEEEDDDDDDDDEEEDEEDDVEQDEEFEQTDAVDDGFGYSFVGVISDDDDDFKLTDWLPTCRDGLLLLLLDPFEKKLAAR